MSKVKELITSVPPMLMHVSGASSLELQGYNIVSEQLETVTPVSVPWAVQNTKCLVSPRYVERLTSYSENIYLLSIYDVVCMSLTSWERSDITLLESSGVLQDIREARLVEILNKEYPRAQASVMLSRYAIVKYTVKR